KNVMRLVHLLVGPSVDAGVFLQASVVCAQHRVVVKRAPRSAALSGPRPQFAVQGKAVRFDVYPLKAFPKG
ncbi:MAG: class I SAM-dependent methyltransferase, partial [Spongiibacter sp.]|nr:class I SAM-dependent methyltransferase [Spongiibacter sp.]